MADNVSITPGVGASIATDDVAGIMYQRVKVDGGGDGAAAPILGDSANGLDVDVTRVGGDVSTKPKSGEVWPIVADSALAVSDDDGSLTVDAPVGAPVAVRLSDGSSFIAGLPISGEVSADQGTAASPAGAWPVKLTDGTSLVGVSDVSGAKALKVDVIQSVEGAAVVDDLDPLAKVGTIAGYYKETSLSDPAAGQVAAVRITQKRALHANLRAVDGTELGTGANPVAIKAGDTPGTFPVSGVVTAKLEDSTGAAYAPTNALPVAISGTARAKLKKTVALTASQTAQDLWTPAGGKKFVVEYVLLAITVAGTFTLYDGTDSVSTEIVVGNQATGNREYNFAASPVPASAVNNVLRWSTGSGTVGSLTVIGYEE